MLIRKNDSGRSIVEMLGVLAIMGVITVMGISGYSQAVGKINRNKVIEDVTRITQEVRGLYAAKSDFYTDIPGGDEDDDLLMKIGFRDVNSRHPFGGVYYVTPASAAINGYNRTFQVNISGLNAQDCYYFENYGWEGASTLDKIGECKGTGSTNVATIEFE